MANNDAGTWGYRHMRFLRRNILPKQINDIQSMNPLTEAQKTRTNQRENKKHELEMSGHLCVPNKPGKGKLQMKSTMNFKEFPPNSHQYKKPILLDLVKYTFHYPPRNYYDGLTTPGRKTFLQWIRGVKVFISTTKKVTTSRLQSGRIKKTRM